MKGAAFRMACAAAAAATLSFPLAAQDRLKAMPGAEQWKEDGASFEYAWDGKRYRYDVAAKAATVIGDAPAAAGGRGGAGIGGGQGGRGGRGGQGQPARGRQFESADAPDKSLKAFYKDRNLWLSALDGSNPVQITTDGSEKDRVKYATASWVYGEELGQRTAMWWSPDSRRV